MEKISIIGAGSWGTALAILLSDKGYEVSLYARRKEQIDEIKNNRTNKDYLGDIKIPKDIMITDDIKEAVESADVAVMAVSSQQVRNVAQSIKNYVKKEAVIVNVAKGLEKGTNLRISQVVNSILSDNPFVVLSGPSHAEEVAMKMPTTVVAASDDISKAEYIQDIFSNEYFRVYTNPDVLGVELGGALKNIIAFGVGIIDGLGYGDNTKAAIMTRGITEITRLGASLGGQISTFAGLSGIGDLIVTCTSSHSRNRRAGILIGKGYSLEETLKEIHMVVEGITATEVAYNLAKEKNVDMPITKEIYRVLYENKDVKESVKSLMGRTKKHETEDIFNIDIKQ